MQRTKLHQGNSLVEHQKAAGAAATYASRKSYTSGPCLDSKTPLKRNPKSVDPMYTKKASPLAEAQRSPLFGDEDCNLA